MTPQLSPLGLTKEQILLGSSAALAGIFLFAGPAFLGSTLKLRELIARVLHSNFKNRSAIQIGNFRLSDEARLRHTHIVGATGSGKTVLMEKLLYQDILRGQGALIIDPKGDRELFDRLKAFCDKIGRSQDLHLLSATYKQESVRWNPCRLGDVSELQSKFFNSNVYDHTYYAKAVELALLRAFHKLAENSPSGFTLTQLAQTLQGLAEGAKDDTLKGLYFDLEGLSISEWGEIFGCSESGSQREVSLLDITRRNEILFVDLPTEAKKTQSQRIGRLLLQEITILSGMRKTYPHLRGDKSFSIYVDEFDAFATPAFATFLNKGRSSGFMIHLAHQTLSDLNLVSESFAGQIMGNTNVRFIFRQDDPKDSETWAKFFGTQLTVKRTFQTQDGTATGMSSNREVREFRISPDQIKDLAIGECILSIKTDRLYKLLKVPHGKAGSERLPQFPVNRKPLDQLNFKKPSLTKTNETFERVREAKRLNQAKENL